MQINLPDAPLHVGVPIFGNAVSNNEFQGVLTHGLFKNLVPDPRRLEGTLAKYNSDLDAVAKLRGQVNRLVTGAKRKNVEPYARYIIDMVRVGEGFTPQIVLWCPNVLRTEVDPNTGFAWILVPHEMKFVALDGDTQTTARNLADGLMPGLLDKQMVKVVIKHGVRVDEAQQIFSDCNAKGVKVTTSMAIGMDGRDDATGLAKYIERHVQTLDGKVNRLKRQLGQGDKDLITISALRASAVCFVMGISGVQYQTKGVEIPDEHLPEWQAGGVIWYRLVAEILDGALLPENRHLTFATAPAVWAAIGAIGHDVMTELCGEDFEKSISSAKAEHHMRSFAEARLGGIDWKRAEHWLQVGAKQSMSGAITLGGPKETGSLIYRGLADGTLKSPISTAAA